MAETQKLTVKQYADYRGISRQRVYKYVNNGQLSKAVYTGDGKTKIDPDLADQELSETLDQIYNRPQTRTPKTDRAERLDIQNQAVDIASTGEDETGVLIPWPLWAARYITALEALDPDRVTIEQISKTDWRLAVHDLNTETGQPAPWAVDLSFHFKPDQVEV